MKMSLNNALSAKYNRLYVFMRWEIVHMISRFREKNPIKIMLNTAKKDTDSQ